MDKTNFSEEDYNKYVQAINFMAENAKFDQATSIPESIKLRNHYLHLQLMAGKIKDHILEVGKLTDMTKESKKKSK